MTIKEALAKLDPFDNDHWTADGAPAIVAVTAIFGDKVTRKEITDADPLFTRDLAGQLDDVKLADVEPDPVSDIDNLKVQEIDLNQQIKAITVERETMKADLKRLHAERDTITEKLLVIDPPMSNMEGIQAYIAASNASRARRHGVAQAVAAALPPGLARTKAPIDEAFARRSGRGIARPVR